MVQWGASAVASQASGVTVVPVSQAAQQRQNHQQTPMMVTATLPCQLHIFQQLPTAAQPGFCFRFSHLWSPKLLQDLCLHCHILQVGLAHLELTIGLVGQHTAQPDDVTNLNTLQEKHKRRANMGQIISTRRKGKGSE
jgi:hypothetical protein